MRDFARLNVYVADGNVLQTEQLRYVKHCDACIPPLPWRHVTMTTEVRQLHYVPIINNVKRFVSNEA